MRAPPSAIPLLPPPEDAFYCHERLAAGHACAPPLSPAVARPAPWRPRGGFALRLLDLRGSGVAGLSGLEHALSLTDLYLDDPGLDLSPLEGLGVVVHLDAPPGSADATLSGLELSGVDIGAFDPATSAYAAAVDHAVTETTVTPTTNGDWATYVIRLDGAVDADGTVSLAEGSNVVTVEVTAEHGQTTKTYTVIVTRAAAPASATFSVRAG